MVDGVRRAGGGSAVLDDAQRGDCGREGGISMAARSFFAVSDAFSPAAGAGVVGAEPVGVGGFGAA